MRYKVENERVLQLIRRSENDIQIFVEISAGKTMTLEVKLTDIIENIFRSRQLDGGRVLAYYKISQGNVLDLQLPPVQMIAIYINTLGLKLIPLEIDSSNTGQKREIDIQMDRSNLVVDVKEIIQVRESIVRSQQSTDYRALSSYKIENGSRIYLEILFSISVNIPEKETITLQVSPHDTVRAIKQNLCDKENISIDAYLLQMV